MRLLELYDTVQGEGPNVGQPTTFVRFAGCNMRCPGWPCDTPYSIYPDQWKTQYREIEPPELLRELVGHFKHICITGGEPLIQPRIQMQYFMEGLWERGYTFDLFTNGSRPFQPYKILRDATSTVVMDWKLAGSGESNSYRETRLENLKTLRHKDAIKFVVKNIDDLHEAKDVMSTLPNPFPPRVYIGPAWDLITPEQVVEFILEHKLDAYLNLQTHKYVFPGRDRGI